jgi:hypothetical protein
VIALAPARRPVRWSQLAGALLLMLLAGGCRSLVPAPAIPAAGLHEPPWKLPEEALRTQRLYRARYAGLEGEGSFLMTLRLHSEERFQLTAADRLGGRLWALEAAAAGGVWIDFRRQVFCPRPEQVPLLDWGPAGALVALPRVLLGRLPAAATAVASVTAGPGRLDLVDELGRQWTALVGAGGVEQWVLWEAGEVAWRWRRQGREAVLAQGGNGRQVSWQEIAAEPLARPPEPLEVPRGFREECW